MKICSWNVNSVRARINNILAYLKLSKPEILLIQEIKTEEKNFPFNDFKRLGYESYVFGQKSYNGVAFLSKVKVNKINTKFFKDQNNHSRIIEGDIKSKFNNFKLINIYAPNGNPIDTAKYEYKKSWYDSFIKKIEDTLIKNKNIIIGGDFNIIPEEIDVHDPKRYENDALFKLEIRKKILEIINLGFYDVYRHFNKNKYEYTFWEYMAGAWPKNHGMRIDHFLISSSLLNNVKRVSIDKKPRGNIKPSDHTPIVLELN